MYGQYYGSSTIFCFLIFFALMMAGAPIGQLIAQEKQHPFIAAQYMSGTVLNTNKFVGGDNLAGSPIRTFQGYSIKIGLQNPGYRNWQRIYRMPYYGLGFLAADFNTSEIGKPYSAFGFLGIPIVRWRKVAFYTELQYGMAWHWNHYDSIQNPKNVAIGSGITVHAAAGIHGFCHLSNYIDIGAAMNFAHFSNGRFERPNNGLNLTGPSLEMRCHLAGRPDIGQVREPERHRRKNELSIVLGYGDHQLTEVENDTNYYAVGGLSLIYSMQHGNVFRSGLGLDANFWWSLTANPNGTPGKVGWDNLTAGLIYQPEVVMGRFTMLGGIGIYARHLQYGSFKQFYQRLGVRYNFTNYLSLAVNIRAVNFYEAEFLEFQMGYHFQEH